MSISLLTTSRFMILVFLGAILVGCAVTKEYKTDAYNGPSLTNLNPNSISVEVKDFRAEQGDSHDLAFRVQNDIERALAGTNKIHSNYQLEINIIENRAFFTIGNWHGISRIKLKLRNISDELGKEYVATGQASRMNMWGYSTAQAVTQDAYNSAMADAFSFLSSLKLK